MLGIDAGQTEYGQCAHDSHHEEHAGNAEKVPYRSSEHGRRCVAGVTPGFVSAEPGGKSLLPHHAQRDTGKRRSNGRRRDALKNTGEPGGRRAALHKDQTAARHDKTYACRNESALVPSVIGQRPERRDAEQFGQSSCGHDKADFIRRPVLFLQIDAEKRPQTVAHVGKSKTEQREKYQRSLFRRVGHLLPLFN